MGTKADTDALEAEVFGASRDDTVNRLAKSVEALVSRLGKSVEEAVHRGPAAPADVDDERFVNIDEERFRGHGAEPEDEPDERARRSAESRQTRVASKSRDDEDEREEKSRDEHDEEKSRREDDEERSHEERDMKSRKHGEDCSCAACKVDKSRDHDEDCECSGCKARKSRDKEEAEKSRHHRGMDDDAAEAIDDSQRAYIYDEDWDEDDEDLHGYFEDPASTAAPGSEHGDKTIITNMGRRMESTSDRREGKKSRTASERFFQGLAKSRRAAALVNASEELNYLTTVLGKHFDHYDGAVATIAKSQASLASELKELRGLVKAMGAVVVDLAKAHAAEIPEPPATGVPVGLVPVQKSRNADDKTPTVSEVQTALFKGLGSGIVDTDKLASFDAWLMTPQAQVDLRGAVRQWIETRLDPEQASALGIGL